MSDAAHPRPGEPAASDAAASRRPREPVAAASAAAASHDAPHTHRRAPSALRSTLAGAAFAVTFLTIVPLRVRDADGARAAPAFFALVGLGLGAAAGGIDAAARTALPPLGAAVLALAALAVLTGGLHLDGLADCADGLGVRGDRARRLEVMRDPATGSFGTLALVGWALLATASLAALDSRHAIAALMVAAAGGRGAALAHARLSPPARPDGLGASFRPGLVAVALAGLTVVAVAALALPAHRWPAVAVTLAAAVLLTTLGARRLVGGFTGDTLGATVVLTELALLVVLSA